MTITTHANDATGHHQASATSADRNKELSADKVKQLKRQVREISEQNEALVKDLSRARKRLRHLVKEKSILLDRLCKYDTTKLRSSKPHDIIDEDHESLYEAQANNDSVISSSSPAEPLSAQPTATEKTPRLPIPHNIPPVPAHQHRHQQPLLPPTALMPPPSSSATQQQQHRQPPRSQPPAPNQLPPPAPPPPTNQPIMDVMHQNGMVPSSRPKRMRRGTLEPKVRRVQPIEKDPVSGEYKLPARVGILTVHALGRVVPLPSYHNDRYIWPPGFKVSRTYLSMVNPSTNTVYTCSVEENGEQGPRFRVVAEDCPDQPIIANSATGVWTAIVKRANEIRNRDHSNSASGPDYYGFTHATIAKMIQDLPGAANCINYVWQTFGEMHQKTAAGVAAASLRKLTNLEIMGSANKRPPQEVLDDVNKRDQREEPGDASPPQKNEDREEEEEQPSPQVDEQVKDQAIGRTDDHPATIHHPIT